MFYNSYKGPSFADMAGHHSEQDQVPGIAIQFFSNDPKISLQIYI